MHRGCCFCCRCCCLQAAENVRALMDSLPPMRPLVMVLKVFLQQRELNEVGGEGGGRGGGGAGGLQARGDARG